MDSKTYWQKRETEALKHYITDEKEYSKQLIDIYDNMLDNCQKEIDAFYGKYAKKEDISINEAKKRVSNLDIEKYERKAKKYVKDKDFSKEANEEMRLYNLTMKVNRLEMLKANIGLELISGHDELQKFMRKILKGRTEDELKRQAGILGKTIKNNSKYANAIVNGSFKNATFSQRIWAHQDLLKNDLNKLLQQGMIQGKGARELAKELKKRFDIKKSDAERLMRTELARVQTEAQKQSFERNGFTQYTFIVNGGCCPICQALSGKHFKVKDMMPGENAPPMHPYCRCSTSAYEDSKEYEAWLDYLDKGGTTEAWEWMKEKKSGVPLNLQYFARNTDKKELLSKIEKGIINKKEFEENHNYFRSKARIGITTPIETVYDKSDRYYHIVNHHDDMLSKDNVKRIINTLRNPDIVYKTKDKFGIEGKCYVENESDKPLIVITRNDIITAYIPNKNYLRRIKGGEVLWKKN